MKKFIYGFLFAISFPIIQEFVDVVCNYLEVSKGRSSLEVNKINKEIIDIQNKNGNSEAIGFQCNDNCSEEDGDNE